LKALQQQKVASYVLICGLYLCSLPCSYFFAVEGTFGVQGLWLGHAIGNALVLFLYFVVYASTSWETVFEIVQEQRRLKEEMRIFTTTEQSTVCLTKEQDSPPLSIDN